MPRRAFAAVLLLAAAVPAQPPAASQAASTAPASAPAALQVEVQTRTAVLTGALERLTPDGALVLATSQGPQVLAAGEAGWFWLSASTPRSAVGDVVYLRSGERVCGLVSLGDDQHLVVADSAVNRRLDLPWSAVAGVVFAAGRVSPRADELAALAEAGAERQDQLYLANGDVVEGTLAGTAGADGSQVAIRTAKAQLKVLRSVLLAMALAELTPESAPAAADRAVVAMVYLVDGSAVHVRDLAYDRAASSELKGTLVANGRPVRLASSDVLRVELAASAGALDQRRFTWLSALSPSEQKQEPFVTLRRTPQRDRCVTGGPLVLGGRTYPRGWGLGSATRLRFELPEGATRFVARVGVDDSGSRFSHADVSLLVDGREVFARKALMLGVAPEPVNVDVAGAKTLELVVDYGLYGDLGDHVNWADAAIVK